MNSSRFVTALDKRLVSYDGSGRPIYQLLSDLVYESARFGRHVVKAGFRTNLCSTPRWPIAFWLAGDLAHCESALHDAKYTDHDVSKEVADLLFLEAMGAPKVVEPQLEIEPWRRRLMYEAVAKFGQSSWDAPTTIWQPPELASHVSAGELVAP